MKNTKRAENTPLAHITETSQPPYIANEPKYRTNKELPEHERAEICSDDQWVSCNRTEEEQPENKDRYQYLMEQRTRTFSN